MNKHTRTGIAVLTTLLAWLGIAQPAQAARLPVTSTTALSKIQQEVPGLLTSLRKVKRDGFYAWAVTIKRSDGSVVVGYVDRKSGIVFDWTVQTAPDEPILDLDGADRSRRPATPPPAIGEPLPPTAAVDAHPKPKPVVAVAAADPTVVQAASVAPAPAPSASAESLDDHDDTDDHDSRNDHNDVRTGSTEASPSPESSTSDGDHHRDHDGDRDSDQSSDDDSHHDEDDD